MGWKTWKINVLGQITLVRQIPVQTSLNGQFSIGANNVSLKANAVPKPRYYQKALTTLSAIQTPCELLMFWAMN